MEPMFNQYGCKRSLGLALAALLALAACGGGGSGGGSSSLNVSLSDAPTSRAGVVSVFVTVTGVEVQPASGPAISIPLMSPLTVDLLSLQKGNVAPLVNAASVQAGSYSWIRLDLDTSAGKDYVLVCADGTTTCASPGNIPLTIPSGAETGLKIVRGFTLPVNGAIHLVVDFNVDSSVVPIPNSTSWHLKPTLRVVQTDTVGSIEGTISAGAMNAAGYSVTACGPTNLPTVYVYPTQSATTNVTPDDIFTGTEEATETAVQPIVTQLTTYNAADGSASFNIQWLASDSGYNEYTVAFTCDPDDPNIDESAIVPPATTPTITFNTYQMPVAVTTGMTSTVSF
jgi:hypothetical protein